MEKGFFKVFITQSSANRLKIPTEFTDYKNGKFPRKVSLRDRYGNMWPVGVTKTGRNFCFQSGWKKFIEENTVEFGDFLVFDYDGFGFDFILLGRNGSEKKGVGGLKLAREMNDEHQKNVEPKRKNCTSDSSSSSSDDDSDTDYMVEEETQKASHSKCKNVEEEEDNDDDDEEEEENEKDGTFMKKTSRSKAGCNRATARKVIEYQDQFGVDIFKSGRATQPKNPYFVANIKSSRRDQLYVPIDVVNDYKLELPLSMTIHDSAGRKFETKLESWKDGRIWLIGGWRSLCSLNLVERNDKCICEFVRGKRNKGLYLQVQVLREGASSHSNKKNKK